MASHNELGKLGEEMAAQDLQSKGYQILEKNWRYLKAEIDIITVKDNTLIIVEVKTRTTDFFGNPEEFISTGKKRLIIKAADAYIQQRNLDIETRFDVYAIVKNKYETKTKHIENAFMAFE